MQQADEPNPMFSPFDIRRAPRSAEQLDSATVSPTMPAAVCNNCRYNRPSKSPISARTQPMSVFSSARTLATSDPGDVGFRFGLDVGDLRLDSGLGFGDVGFESSFDAFDEWGASLTLKLDPGEAKRGLWLALAPVWVAEASQVEQMWGSADVLRVNNETDTLPGLPPAQVEFDVGYGLVTHEGAGLLTIYGGLSMAGSQNHGVQMGERIELGEWVDLSVEGERTTQDGGAEQVALYGSLGW